MRIAFFGYGNPELEAHGVRLLNSVSAQLRAQVTVPDTPVAPVGPDFEYQYGLRLFLGRTGRGPLHIAWDTNLLIDYFQHGRALSDHEAMPDLVAGHGDELEALQLVLALWVIRDIRFHILMSVLDDARKALSSSRRAARLQAFLAFTDAIRLVESGEPDVDAPSRDGLFILPETELAHVLSSVPQSDRRLIDEAVRLGVHVFLTRDEGVLACRDALRPFGLLLASPGDLLGELFACGAFHCLFAPQYAYWPLPDQGRVTHLFEALPSS